MNQDLFYINLFTALVFGAVIFLIVFVLAKYKRKPTYRNQPIEQKTVYASLKRDEQPPQGATIEIQMQDKLTDQINKLTGELTTARTELITTQAERDNYRGLWEQSVQRGKDKAAEFANERNRFMDELNQVSSGFINERYEAQLFANDLREYLDRALGVVNIQNEQIQQLMPKPKGWNLKAYPRDKKGRVVKVAVAHRKIDGNEPLFMQQIGRVERTPIRPEPVQPLHDFEKIADQATQPLADAIDWNVPQPFPEGYKVPKGTMVRSARIDNDIVYKVEKCDHNGVWVKSELGFDGVGNSGVFAPLNPTDHPLHPKFKSNTNS